uniref:Uncharacterized protein n=1 Tax=Steinernema glaseri TaxID=37863 RepID=A0A1I8A5D1_9BILA
MSSAPPMALFWLKGRLPALRALRAIRESIRKGSCLEEGLVESSRGPRECPAPLIRSLLEGNGTEVFGIGAHDLRDVEGVEQAVAPKRRMSSCSKPKLPHQARRIGDSIEGVMRQLIANARDDEDIVLEVEIDAGLPKNPISEKNERENSKHPKEYFVWGYFNQSPKVPHAYQFRSVANSKRPRSSEATSETRLTPEKDVIKKMESMTSTEYSTASSRSSISGYILPLRSGFRFLYTFDNFKSP